MGGVITLRSCTISCLRDVMLSSNSSQHDIIAAPHYSPSGYERSHKKLNYLSCQDFGHHGICNQLITYLAKILSPACLFSSKMNEERTSDILVKTSATKTLYLLPLLLILYDSMYHRIQRAAAISTRLWLVELASRVD